MALPAFRGLIRMPKPFPNFSQIFNNSPKTKISAQNFATIHRWKHHTKFPENIKLKLTVECLPCSIYMKFGTINARFINTRHQCLNQREEQSSGLEVDHIQKELEAENKLTKKQKHAASDPKNSMINVGRFVPDKTLELIDENGMSLGTVNRNQAIALSQEKKLKLVLLKPGAKPWPIYKLMTGQELHEEQVKRNEKAKKKTSPTQLKEIKASWNIGQHDIAVRQRQLENWFSDEHTNIHARVTVMGGKGTEIVPKEKQEAVVKQLIQGMEDKLTLNGPPQMVGKNMANLRVTIRTMSAKEKTAYQKGIAEKGAQKSK